ncbi:MAG: tetratricopeptide repeat protein [Candidatus Rokuibacteriota bacterium]
MTPRRRGVLLGLAVAAITATVFAAGLGNDFVEWDDELNLTGNPHYRGLSPANLRWMATAMVLGHYIPLTWLTFAVDYTIWGMNPVGYHATNLLIHGANAALFYLLALSLLRRASRFSGAGLHAAAVTAALFFALHPLRAESVAWATERRDVLSGFFFLLTMLMYVRASEPSAEHRRLFLTLSVSAFFLGLLSKSIVMTVPVVLLILDLYPLRRLPARPSLWLRPETRSVWREKLPYLILAVAGGAVAYYALVTTTERGPGAEPPLAARPGLFAYSLVFYVTKTLLPVALSPLYELPARVDPWQPRFVGSLLAVAGVATTLWFLRRRWPAGLAAAGYYAVVLSPVGGFVAAGYQLAHDRYSYLSCLGFAVLVGGGVGALLTAASRGSVRARFARIAVAAVAVWIVGLAVLTSYQVQTWRNTETLWWHAVASEPDCSICNGNVGAVLYRTGRPVEALGYLERALALRPDRTEPRYNLAASLLALGRPAEALEHLERLHAQRPDDPAVLNGLGLAMIRLGRYDEATAYLERSVALAPHDGWAHNNLGVALTRRGDAARGIGHFRRAVELMPDAGLPRLGLARAHLDLGDTRSAREHHETLKAIDGRLAGQLALETHATIKGGGGERF